MVLPPGIHAYYSAIGLTTATTLNLGDIIKDAFTEYFQIEVIKPHKVGDRTAFYECQLSHLPMWQGGVGSATWTKTRPQPPQRRMKTYIDTYARAAQITKDDDSTAATFATIWENPPYALEPGEFREATPVFGLYVVGQPNSTPRLDFDQTPSHYEEHVPVHVCTVNSTNCAGATLQWKMEAELRYVCEQNPTGSQIGMERREPNDRMVGSVWMYDTPFILSYVRDITT